ncbi:MAG: hypothetical protein MSH25_04985, partial [Desulfovibrio sp.]|uniref:hypothetical protein n=1 Tax=Desulfovibrio sp. TaxID=885 RepID=UPI0025C121FA
PSRNQGKNYRRDIFRNKKSLERRVGSRRSRLVYFLWIQIISKLNCSRAISEGEKLYGVWGVAGFI